MNFSISGMEFSAGQRKALSHKVFAEHPPRGLELKKSLAKATFKP